MRVLCFPKIGSNFMTRKPIDVVEEIEAAVAKYGITDVALYDDAFLVHAQNHAIPILDAIAERLPGVRLHAPNGLHSSAINRSTAVAMRRPVSRPFAWDWKAHRTSSFHTGGKTDFQHFLSAVGHLKEAGFFLQADRSVPSGRPAGPVQGTDRRRRGHSF